MNFLSHLKWKTYSYIVYEDRVLWGVIDAKRGEATEGWIKMHNEKHVLYVKDIYRVQDGERGGKISLNGNPPAFAATCK
jgi:hypothetical protein